MSSAKHQYLLRLPGALQVLLDLPQPLFDDPAACLLLGAYLPGVEIADLSEKSGKSSQDSKDSEETVTIALRQASKPRLSRSKNGDSYSYFAPNTAEALMDLIFLTYGIARQKWLKQGLYCVHAACLENQQKQLSLIVGHSGVGKTAVTLSALARGYKVFSGNRTLVKITPGSAKESAIITAIAGTRTITTRAEDLARHLPEALEEEEVGYEGRSAFSLSKRFYAGCAPQAVSLISLPRLNDGVEKSRQLSPLSALHKLYPFFLDAVNADIVLAGGRLVFAGTPPNGVSKRLAMELSQALTNLPVWELEGSLPFINHTLEDL